VQGYTILILDANILLSSLPMVTLLVGSLHWTVVVPLPAIKEQDRLMLNMNPLSDAAKAAVAFMISHVHSHADSLKVEMSCGNYLSLLTVCTEQVNFDYHDS
jgi:hypothetical protein